MSTFKKSPAKKIIASVVAIVVATILLLWVAGNTYQPDLSIPADMQGTAIQVGDLSLRVQQKGSGQDVLMIHGSPGIIEDWDLTIEQLGAGFRTTAYDRPGQGYSSVNAAGTRCQANAEVAFALINALQLVDPIVVGHSYGGCTAMAMANTNPAFVKGFVVVDSALIRPIQPVGLLLTLLSQPNLGLGFARIFGPFVAPKKIRQGIERSFWGVMPDPAFVALRQKVWIQPKITHTVALEMTQYRDTLSAMSPSYAQIQKPLVIMAQQDDPERRVQAQDVVKQIAGAQLILVPKTGHYVQIQQPKLVAEAIASLMAPKDVTDETE